MATESTISLKLLVDNTSKRVIFAEAGKDFVDFLFGLLELPLGSLIRLLAQEGMPASWSFGKVYESVKNLDDDVYIQPEHTKQILLAPKPSSNTKGTTHIMQNLGYGKPEPSSSCLFVYSSPSSFAFSSSSSFASSSSSTFVASYPSLYGAASSPSLFGAASSPSLFGASSPSPRGSSSSSLYGSSRDDNRKKEMGGYVKGMVTYMISDDLTVKPVSHISSVSLISSLGVKDIGSLEEKNVEINMKTALELVKTSFESSTVLTDVFVRKIITE